MEAILKLALVIVMAMVVSVEGNWCVARSDASDQALQTALDYACSAGADCVPIQSTGLCYLPNTMQSHASYAFNSFYQRKQLSAGSCDFAGTATIAKTDPSYGSCVYPPNPSTAGAMSTPGTTTPTTATPYGPTTPTTSTTPTTTEGGAGQTPSLGPPIPTTNDSSKSLRCSFATSVLHITLYLVHSLLL